ncbi:MAG: FAD-dependent oxidoreductase [Bdellovibrionales bacterium]|nr:FAD-dependent oxidoreductase [Massilia sp.]
MMTPFHIAVIGAGIAGLSCATALQHAGFQVSVFDKSRGPGGRMSTRVGAGWQCDHGAQYFTASDASFRAEVRRWEAAGAAAQWDPELHQFDRDGSSRCAPEQRFVGTPRMTGPAKLLASALTLRTGTVISALRRETLGWRLQAQGDGWLEAHFDAVVLALPAPQAAPLLRPVAPRAAELADAVSMAGCWAMLLQYDMPQQLGFDAAFVNHGPLRWVARDSAKPGREGAESWLLHASAQWSEAHIDLDSGQVGALLLPAFAALGGAPPQHSSVHRWRYASTVQACSEAFVWDGVQGLGMCGDWLNGGTVEAAWVSGRRLASRIAAS